MSSSTATHLTDELNAVTDTYLNRLDGYTPAQLAAKPSEEEWSVGQVMDHVLTAGKRLMIPAAEKALVSSENASEGKNRAGEVIFQMGGFPDQKIQIPETYDTGPAPRNIDDPAALRERLNEMRDQFRAVAGRLDAENLGGKVQHAALGYLDASEWLENVPMHMRHHLRQLDRLEAWWKETTNPGNG